MLRQARTRVNGYLNYYAITDNSDRCSYYVHCVERILFKWLNRKSQRRTYTWPAFNQALACLDWPNASRVRKDLNTFRRQSKLGNDHPAYFESMHELALLYKKQGGYEKAEPLLLKAIEGRRLKLGDNHPHTIESFNNLIDLYEARNKPEEAKEWRSKLPQTEAKTE